MLNAYCFFVIELNFSSPLFVFLLGSLFKCPAKKTQNKNNKKFIYFDSSLAVLTVKFCLVLNLKKMLFNINDQKLQKTTCVQLKCSVQSGTCAQVLNILPHSTGAKLFVTDRVYVNSTHRGALVQLSWGQTGQTGVASTGRLTSAHTCR